MPIQTMDMVKVPMYQLSQAGSLQSGTVSAKSFSRGSERAAATCAPVESAAAAGSDGHEGKNEHARNGGHHACFSPPRKRGEKERIRVCVCSCGGYMG